MPESAKPSEPEKKVDVTEKIAPETQKKEPEKIVHDIKKPEGDKKVVEPEKKPAEKKAAIKKPELIVPEEPFPKLKKRVPTEVYLL